MMRPEPCWHCTSHMTGVRGDFVTLGRPSVTILEVPALRCHSWGASRLAGDVLDRLAIILEEASRHAESRGLVEVSWTYTPHGPPEVGGMPRDLRDCFATLRGLIAEERRRAEAVEDLGHEIPTWFH